VPSFIKISQTVTEMWRFNGFFFKMAGVHLGFVERTGTTHDDYMVVSIVVQNFFEINMVVSITKLSILCPLGLKMPIHAPNLGFWGDFTPK